MNALSPAPELRDINLTKVDGRDASPSPTGGVEEGDNSTTVIDKQWVSMSIKVAL